MILDDTLIDLTATMSTDPLADSPDGQVWRLLCAQTLGEVDEALVGVQADDIARDLSLAAGYRELDAMAAAYLWLARTQVTPLVIEGG